VRILFDQGTPAPLRRLLKNNQVETVFKRGWHTLTNGELLAAAERDGFDILLTTDKNLRHQQNPRGRSIAVVVLSSTSWPRIQKAVIEINRAIESVKPGSFQYVEIPR
jgi:predicted nuclease of predicted toxin-antitoxin system